MHVSVSVSEALVPNDAKDLTIHAVDLPCDIFIQVVEDRDWHSRIPRRRLWVDSLGSVRAAGVLAGTIRWRPGQLGGSDNNGVAGEAGSMIGVGTLLVEKRKPKPRWSPVA